MGTPLTLVSVDRADVAAVSDVLAPLPREGIYVRGATLLLETSYVGAGAVDFYATAWRWSAADAELLFALCSRGRLVLTWEATVLLCGVEADLSDTYGSTAVRCESVPALREFLAAVE